MADLEEYVEFDAEFPDPEWERGADDYPPGRPIAEWLRDRLVVRGGLRDTLRRKDVKELYRTVLGAIARSLDEESRVRVRGWLTRAAFEARERRDAEEVRRAVQQRDAADKRRL